MLLTIVSPEGVVCDVTVDSVTLPSVQGAFTVLRGHAPIIAQLGAGAIVYSQEGGEEQRVDVRSGFVRVLNDKVEVCVETVKPKQ